MSTTPSQYDLEHVARATLEEALRLHDWVVEPTHAALGAVALLAP